MKLVPAASPLANTRPAVPDASWIGRRNAVGIRETAAIAANWELSREDLATLLGTAPRTLQRWLRVAADSSGELDLDRDTVDRLSLLLGINKALQILFPTPANRLLWLRNANSGVAFNGQAPMARMLSGGLADLHHVRQVLDGARG